MKCDSVGCYEYETQVVYRWCGERLYLCAHHSIRAVEPHAGGCKDAQIRGVQHD